MVPEFHVVVSDVDVCDSESVFVHVTVVPSGTLSSSGANALLPSDSAPRGIETDDEGPDVGEGTADGPVDGDVPLL